MTIVPISLKNSSSVVEFFKHGGQVEIERPQQCFNAQCRLKEPMWKNGSYARQVIYWGLCFVLQILRFRCRQCGKTASCPYGWLVPYCRFSAEVITAGIEAYASEETTYTGVSTDLSAYSGERDTLVRAKRPTSPTGSNRAKNHGKLE